MHAPPFDIGFTDEFFQKIVRVEDLLAVGGQNDERLLKVVKQKLAPFHATE
jgi:hypothetical protein